MKKLALLLLGVSALVGCQDEVPVAEVLSQLTLTPRSLPADGQSTAQISVTLPKATSADRRSVIFSTSRGVFAASGTDKYTAKAEFVNGELVARATLRAPLQPGGIGVTAQLEYDSPIRDYALTDSLHASPSVAASLVLEPSRSGIAANFVNEVRVVGSLRNADNRYVSRNTRVLFEDRLLSGAPANGRFRNRQLLSNDTSRVSTFYGAAAYPIGTTIRIRGTVLDAKGAKTAVADSVLLTINL